MSYPYPIPVTRVISPSPTPSEASERDSYFAPVTRSAAKQQRHKSPESIAEEKDGSGSDSSLEKRARSRSRDSVSTLSQVNGTAVRPRRRMSGLTPKTPVTTSQPITNGNIIPEKTNGNLPPEQTNGHLSPYDRMQKTWRDFSRSPSPLGLIPLHRHYRYLIHKHEIPRKALHVSIGFMTLGFYTHGIQTRAITPWLLGALIPIASVDLLRHRFKAFNRLYVRCLGALMRETEVDGYNGVIWYLLGAIIALQFYPKDIGVMSILLLSWCDTAASTFGRLYGRYTVRLRRGKSLAGTAAAFATGVVTAVMFWGWLAPRTGTFPDDPEGGFMFKGSLGLPLGVTRYLGWKDGSATMQGALALVVMSIGTGIIAAASEFLNVFSLDDNLTIPVLSSFGLWAALKVFGQ